MPEQWKLICKVKDIPPLGVRVVQRGLAWQELPGVALFRAGDDGIFALLDRCPLGDGPLSQGIVGAARVTCPLHTWDIDLATGRAAAPEQGSARVYAVRIEDGRIYLDGNELNAPASKAEAALAGSFSVSTHIVTA
ncbi:MAG TPA: nitrite reductase (NAD(P)H) small subunit [Janthinobacterium sp.]|nr:nitrite reductase (NAD(P)H) small subunit [Janthinobacterium sp.]